MQLSKTCSKYVRKRSSLVCMRQSLIFYPLFNFEWCIRFMTNEGFRCWWDYVVSSPRVWRQCIYEMALGHCEEKGKSFWPAEYLFRKRTRSRKIRKDQVQWSRCRKSLLATKLENLLNYVKLFAVYLNKRKFSKCFWRITLGSKKQNQIPFSRLRFAPSPLNLKRPSLFTSR